MKRSLRKDKRDWINGVAREAEEAASLGQLKGVYVATRRLCNEGPRKAGMVKSKEGKLLTKERRGISKMERALHGSLKPASS